MYCSKITKAAEFIVVCVMVVAIITSWITSGVRSNTLKYFQPSSYVITNIEDFADISKTTEAIAANYSDGCSLEISKPEHKVDEYYIIMTDIEGN